MRVKSWKKLPSWLANSTTKEGKWTLLQSPLHCAMFSSQLFSLMVVFFAEACPRLNQRQDDQSRKQGDDVSGRTPAARQTSNNEHMELFALE